MVKMRQFSLLGLLALFFFVSVTFAQDDEAAPADGAAPADVAAEDKPANATEECEEAWEYVEFLKENVKNKIEVILQDTLFVPRPLLDQTVTEAMEQVLEIRDAVLERTKLIRTEDESITICPEQNIRQEEFLTQLRMQIMAILLQLIEKDAATAEKLQDVGKQLLAIRTKTNSEITRMIMLRESKVAPTLRSSDACDCGILGQLEEQLDAVVNKGDMKEEANATETDDMAAGNGNPLTDLNMILMDVDAEIRKLYSTILSTLDDEAREKLSTELQNIKAISTELHSIMSKLSELDAEEDKDAIERIIRRDVRGILNDVKRLLAECLRACPGECSSCGAKKIDEISEKLNDFKASLADLEEEEAMESIRAETMTFLTETNSEMTELLKTKANSEDGIIEECDAQKLEVIDKIKGPLWMMVNITIFGDGNTMTQMIGALEAALTEIREGYCGPANVTEPVARIEESNCFLDEINTAKEFIVDIDNIIAEDLFKTEKADARKEAMLALIDMKSNMDERVRRLFQENLQCKEEVEQIKNVYAGMLTECLAELMNPRYRFEDTPRAQRVACIKGLRIAIEERRGELLMREIELRINEAGVNGEDEVATDA